MVKAAFALPFRLAMRKNGVSESLYFGRNRLPLAKLEDPESLVPEKPFWHLINQVATGESIPDFGMQVAQARPWIEIETLRPLLLTQTDLRSLLERFCEVAMTQSNASAFDLRIGARECRFESLAKPLLRLDIQMELYRVTSMIELVQVCTGKQWRPSSISLRMKPNRVVEANRILDGCLLQFSRRRTALKFPHECLASPTRSKHHEKHRRGPGAANGIDSNVSDLTGGFSEILDNYVTEPELSVEYMADIAGVSVRSLQRIIHEQGQNYRGLLNQARERYASRKLDDPAMTIGAIAAQLGYNDAAHFTRAFKRWTGLTPTAYRAQNRKKGTIKGGR